MFKVGGQEIFQFFKGSRSATLDHMNVFWMSWILNQSAVWILIVFQSTSAEENSDRWLVNQTRYFPICQKNHFGFAKKRKCQKLNELKNLKKSKNWKKNIKAYNLLARYIESQTKSRCDCEICQIHNSMPTTFTLADIAKSNSKNIK